MSFDLSPNVSNGQHFSYAKYGTALSKAVYTIIENGFGTV